MQNALSIDLEYWYSAELVSRCLPSGFSRDDQIVESVTPILALLDRFHTRATFFVLGRVAEKYPELIRDIHRKGHEIASHGYSHRRLHDLGKEAFALEIGKSRDILMAITGRPPLGFRAPSFSMDNTTGWALTVLGQHGFRYDSSIFPVRTPLYGVPRAPLSPYRPSAADVAQDKPDGGIMEVPLTVFRMGRINLPVAGGFYLRLLPLWFTKAAIRKVNEQRPAVIYLHPWETFTATPRVRSLSGYQRWVSYRGIGGALAKLEGLLQTFTFRPIVELLPGGGR